MDRQLDRICRTFATRLETLDALLTKAATQWRDRGDDAECLLGERLAGDMLPLVYQVAYACEQPRQFALFCQGGEGPTIDPTGWSMADTHRAIGETVRATGALGAHDDSLFERDKHIQLQGGASLRLSGIDYVEEWLVPNFYFHLVTAYDILRHLGVALGKADYMAHVRPYVKRPNA